MKTKKILFICKHNVFRSKVAESLFNKLNKNKNYRASSAGFIKVEKKDLKGDKLYLLEKRLVKKNRIRVVEHSKGLNSSVLKKTDLLVIVADNVPSSILKKGVFFKGKLLVWKARDVRFKDPNPEKVILNSIKFIEKKIEELVKKLK